MALSAAVIGCGVIGAGPPGPSHSGAVTSHVAAYAAAATTSLAAVCDIDMVKAAESASAWGAIAYGDHRAMLEEVRPALVSVCTPDATHFEVLRDVLSQRSVRGVLAEKPLALDLDEAREISRLAKQRNIRLAVNYSRRYAASHQRLRDFIRTGGLGDVQAVHGLYTKGTIHNGTHWFDLARFLVADVARASGRDSLREGGPDPTLDAVLEFETGAFAHLQAVRSTAFTVFEMDIVGRLGRVRLTDAGRTFETFEVAESHLDAGHRALKPTEGLTGGLEDVMLNAVLDLVDAVASERNPSVTAADGIEALKIAQAVRASMGIGAAIDIATL